MRRASGRQAAAESRREWLRVGGVKIYDDKGVLILELDQPFGGLIQISKAPIASAQERAWAG